MNPTATETSPESLRDAMITKVKDAGYPLRDEVEHALRSVQRHLFVPDTPLEEAYANDIVVRKQAADDQVLSCLSQPSIVALQLGQLDVQPGHRVLEVGAGVGYNAALLAHLAGRHGHVTSIDVDAGLVDEARQRLAIAGVSNVDVVLGDGALGHQPGAAYDRIVATVGVYDIPGSWLEQLAPTGRLVAPVRLRGSVSRSIAFERDDDGAWRSVDHQMCGFVPLREGSANDTRQIIALTKDNTVRLQLNQEHNVDPAGLVDVFSRPRYEGWTGVQFGPMQSVEWLYLWLACVLDTSVCSMRVEHAAVDAGWVAPMFGWGAMAVPGNSKLAYLTWRVAGYTEDDAKIMEVGVIGHSDTGAALVNRIAEEIRTWNEQHRNPAVQFEIPRPASTPRRRRRAGSFSIGRGTPSW